jgi:hypothetical protein
MMARSSVTTYQRALPGEPDATAPP